MDSDKKSIIPSYTVHREDVTRTSEAVAILINTTLEHADQLNN